MNSTMPQFSPVDKISYGVSFNLSFLLLKIRSIVSISCIANCSERRSSPDFTITLRMRQVFREPKILASRSLYSYCLLLSNTMTSSKSESGVSTSGIWWRSRDILRCSSLTSLILSSFRSINLLSF